MKTAIDFRLVLSVLSASALACLAASPTNSLPTPLDELDNYKLAAQDKLVFKIEQDPIAVSSDGHDASLALIVNSRGDLEVPVSRGYLDTLLLVKARGRTVSDLKKEIKEKLEEQYYKAANISLYLISASAKAGQVTFYGEVKGVMPLPPGQRSYLSEAVLSMKPNEYANLKNVQLLRTDPATRKVITYKINVDEILGKGLKDKDMMLQDGDTIRIYAKWLNFN